MTYYQYYIYNFKRVVRGELSDSEWLNLTQLTVDGLVNIVDNIEHSHDSGIVHVVRDNRIVGGVNNDFHMFDYQ